MQQRLAIIKELGGFTQALPVLNSFSHHEELTEYSHTFFSTATDGMVPPTGRWTHGPSLDGKGELSVRKLVAMGEEPQLAPPIPEGYAQVEERHGGQARVAMMGASNSSEGILSRLGHGLSAAVGALTGTDKPTDG